MSRPRLLLPALGLALALVAGCAADDGVRPAGDAVTAEEARTLAELLHRNQRNGGADFVATVPYGDGAVLTLAGEVDFRRGIGSARVATGSADGDARTVVFTAEDVWIDAGGVGWLHRPVELDVDRPRLLDVVVAVVLNLSAGSADDPRAFLDGDHAWEGQRSIDRRLTSVYRLGEGRTVAVAASGRHLVQFVAPLPGADTDVTVTLADHGPRALAVPDAEDTVELADLPEPAGVGL
jgi:hypothetical protein